MRLWAGAALVAAGLAAGLTACAEEATPAITRAEYVDALALICTETGTRLDALVQPDGAGGVPAFATAVAEVLRSEAELARGLSVPEELDADHRALIRNTDDQAARWEELSAMPSTDAGFGDLTREIGELTLGRNDLIADMGVDACERAAG
jgi:hypothetical protein